ncbi:MAG: TolB family protein, partial [Bacteroidota bacterium]
MQLRYTIVSLVLLKGFTADAQVLPATDNLIAEGLDPIPMELVKEVNRYTNVRSASFVDWHPQRREMLISTRFGNTSQLHEVRMPMGSRRQITFFDEPVGGATYQPTDGRYFIFSRDAGGNEFAQLYRYDVSDGTVTLLTDGGRSQNGGMEWNERGDKVLYTSTRRNGSDRDIWMMDPMKPSEQRMVLELNGGGWGVSDWSDDEKRFIVGESVSVNESRLWMVDLQSGQRSRLSPEVDAQVVF